MNIRNVGYKLVQNLLTIILLLNPLKFEKSSFKIKIKLSNWSCNLGYDL